MPVTAIEPKVTIHPSQNAIDQARAELSARMAADKAAGAPHFDSAAAMTDPVSTVYVRAMTLDGFQPRVGATGCLDLSVCPTCQRGSAYTFIGADRNGTGNQEFQVCANCDMPNAM